MNDKYIHNFIKAGSLAAQVRHFGKSLIKKGASYNEIIAQVNEKIAQLGAKPAFPPQIALNHVAAHFLPEPGVDIILTDQVVKLDVGVCYNGSIGDCAVTVDLSGHYQSLIDATEAALLAAEQKIKVGQRISEIGKTIEDIISLHGFSPVRNLSGHGLGYYKIHTAPTIPNCYDGSKALITPGMSFAIEPFATNGRGYIKEEGEPTIFALVKEKRVQSEIGRFLVKKMGSFNGLPFAIHHFVGGAFSPAEVKSGFDELLQAGIIAGYPPLIEDISCMVAQAENSVLVDKQGNVFVTTRS